MEMKKEGVKKCPKDCRAQKRRRWRVGGKEEREGQTKDGGGRRRRKREKTVGGRHLTCRLCVTA